MDISHTDPFTDHTYHRSVAWYRLRALFLMNKINLAFTNEDVPIATIERNPEDGGKAKWDTPLFEIKVTTLMDLIQHNQRFEAVWLKLEDGKLTVMDGHHRITAWQRLGNTVVPAVVVGVTPFVSEGI